ncbi:MAG: SurA N-terminal domain-containing protein [Candidatus Omnitrophica bacterium]|nr:SurA N-terminal domain-containing protein [Candidatus Omnitrophota bacterium]
MKDIFSIIIIAQFLFAGFNSEAAEVAKIIAKVNGQVITTKDLEDYCSALEIKFSEGDEKLSCDDPEFRKKALDKLIEDRLILDEAKKEKIEVPPSVINEKLEQMMVSYPSKEDFDHSMAEKGLTITSLKEIIKEKYLMQVIIEKNVRSQISVSPQEISDLYSDRHKDFVAPQTYVFYIAQSPDFVPIKELGMAIDKYGITKVSEKSNMLVKIESSLEELRPELFQILKDLALDEYKISDIEGIYFILYLTQIKEPRLLPLSEVKEHLYGYIKEVKFKQRFEEWVKELRERGVIKKLQ